MTDPLVSLIIAAYQAERFLAEALESTRVQTYRPLEVIVVDDGSTDGTTAVAACFPEVICVRLGTNRGLPTARNAGIERARGELLAFLDADDVMVPERIEVQAQPLLDDPECGCVLARFKAFVEPGATLPIIAAITDLSGAPAVMTASPVLRRSAMEAVGGYDPSYRVAEDMDLLLRLEAAGVVIRILDDVLIRRRFHGANLTYDGQAIHKGMLRSVRRQIAQERNRQGPDRPD